MSGATGTREVWTFCYRLQPNDTDIECHQCGTRRYADVGDCVAELVDAPDRDSINESLQDGFCSRSCAKLWAHERGWTCDDVPAEGGQP